MTPPCFLLDENLSHAIARGLHLREPEVQVLVVGREGAPPLSTSDPALLHWIEQKGCLLVTNNRATMSLHLRRHLESGHHVPGILIVPRRWSPGEVIDELHLIWGASLPNEYQDQIVYLPISH